LSFINKINIFFSKKQFSLKNESFSRKNKKKKINVSEFESADSWQLITLFLFILFLTFALFLRKRAMMAHEIAKNLLPELHVKTHFQAARCISNNMPGKMHI